MAAVTLKNVVKRFGGFEIIHGANIDVDDGEFVVFVGPSGCGKSTLLRMIAGLEDISGGEIAIGGKVVNDVEPADRGIAMVFQSYALYPHMSVYENIAFPLRAMRKSKAEIDGEVRSVAKVLQIIDLLGKKPSALSGGDMQRVAIGRSAIMEPAIFLLDEPLSNVDAAFRAVMRTELKQLQRQFRQTMVYVTHDQLEAMTMADRIAVMDHGLLQQVGTPLEVYNDPANVFVARFIGAPGMNLLRGRPAESDRGLVVDLGPLGVTPPLPAEVTAAVRGSHGDVLYGFRPEQATLVEGGRGLSLPVTFVERIGARTIIHLGDGEAAVKAVFDNDVGLSVGQTTVIAPAAQSVRVFDAATGLAMKAG
ncbi:MAG: ABC transporter ATP-binding protein [Mesorhizobium sp.]|nr:MAG: ABC transporter ATP-binding protein [Mesorhizobium sp.]